MSEYRVEADKTGCEHCGAGALWAIVDSTETAQSTMYEDKEHAEDLCEDLNAAFDRGAAQQAREIAELKKQIPAGDEVSINVEIYHQFIKERQQVYATIKGMTATLVRQREKISALEREVQRWQIELQVRTEEPDAASASVPENFRPHAFAWLHGYYHAWHNRALSTQPYKNGSEREAYADGRDAGYAAAKREIELRMETQKLPSP